MPKSELEGNEEKPESEAPIEEPEPQADKEGVFLTPEQYNALLDRVEELEMTPPQSYDGDDDIDTLANEGLEKSTYPQQTPNKSLEEMNQTELAQFILSNVEEYGKGMATEIQTLKVLREIDKCENKYEDFWDYEEEVHKLAVDNPTLSVEQCYKLSKKESPARDTTTSDKTQGRQRTKTEKLLNLPSVSGTGEKPSISAGATKPGGNLSLKEAAQAAFAEVTKGGSFSGLK